MTNPQWLELIKSSPQKAFHKIMEEYGRLIYAIVLNKLGSIASPEEIEDCISDVFVNIIKSINKFTDISSIKSYISSIAKYTAIDAYRRLYYQKKITFSIDDDMSVLPYSVSDTESEAERKILSNHLWEIVLSLGSPDTDIIVYQYFFGMNLHEISNRLNLTYDAVKMRSMRARKRIKEILLKEETI